MSEVGQSRRFRDVGCESALPPRTDIVGWVGHVGKVPTVIRALSTPLPARSRAFRRQGCRRQLFRSPFSDA
jgi:hypothetical protein